MKTTGKVAVSLPKDLLRDLERARKVQKLTRSEFVRRAVAESLRRERERRDTERYVRSYREQPETAEEVALAESMSKASLEAWADLPWDEKREDAER